MSEKLGPTPPETQTESSTNHEAVNQAEQIERFKSLRNLLDRNSNYSELYDNMYKYANQVSIEGVPNDRKEATLDQVRRGNELIREVLEYYLEKKKHEASKANPAPLAFSDFLDKVASYSQGFVDYETGQLKVDNLAEMLRWALNAGKLMGNRLGQPLEIADEEIDRLSQNLQLILTEINSSPSTSQ